MAEYGRVSTTIPEGFPASWKWYPLPLGIASAAPPPDGGFAGALLLDRDGTLIEDGHFLADPARVVLVPEALQAIRLARAKRWAVGLVSNQGGIGLGRFGWSNAAAVHRALLSLLADQRIELDVALMSPFHPEGNHPELGSAAQLSRGRKPEPGMIELAVQMLGVGGGDVLVVGDKPSDVAAANAAGVEAIQVIRRDAGGVGGGGWERVHERLRGES